MSFYCNICHKSFATNQTYKRHINNKNVHNNNHKYQERPTEYKYICECGKQYLHKTNLHTHKQKIHPKEHQTDTINRLEREKQVLRDQLEELLSKPPQPTGVINNNTNIENQQVNIHINAFGHENLDYITDSMLICCIGKVYDSIPSIIEKIHFHPNHPENHNIKIPNKKLPYASIMMPDQTWKTTDRSTTIDTLIHQKHDLLSSNYDEHKSSFSPIKQKYINNYSDKFENDDKQMYKQLHNKVDCIIMDGSRKLNK